MTNCLCRLWSFCCHSSRYKKCKNRGKIRTFITSAHQLIKKSTLMAAPKWEPRETFFCECKSHTALQITLQNCIFQTVSWRHSMTSLLCHILLKHYADWGWLMNWRLKVNDHHLNIRFLFDASKCSQEGHKF